MKDKLEKLYARRTFGIKLGLDVEKALLKCLGDPQDDLLAVHVAGTNGKGSVSAFLESILLSAGFKTGLYTSPHLVKFNERFRVNGLPVSDERLLELLEMVEAGSEKVKEAAGQEPTFFECSTAIAFKHFQEEDVQLAILETGMGGRLDATNIVTPLISVITRISMDHTMYLGDTIEAVAAEKAGIIKPSRSVVCGAMDDAAKDVIKRVAAEKKAPFIDATEHVSVRTVSRSLEGQKVHIETQNGSYGTVTVSMLGDYQIENLSIAVATIEVLAQVLGKEFDDGVVKEGLSRASWPGRCQLVNSDPPVIVDGAHNPDAAEALVSTLKHLLKDKPVALVFGMCSDKDMRMILKPFSGIVKKMWVVPIKSDRNMDSAGILAEAGHLGIDAVAADLDSALKEAKEFATTNEGAVCVAGSLFLVGEVLARKLHE